MTSLRDKQTACLKRERGFAAQVTLPLHELHSLRLCMWMWVSAPLSVSLCVSASRDGDVLFRVEAVIISRSEKRRGENSSLCGRWWDMKFCCLFFFLLRYTWHDCMHIHPLRSEWSFGQTNGQKLLSLLLLLFSVFDRMFSMHFFSLVPVILIEVGTMREWSYSLVKVISVCEWKNDQRPVESEESEHLLRSACFIPKQHRNTCVKPPASLDVKIFSPVFHSFSLSSSQMLLNVCCMALLSDCSTLCFHMLTIAVAQATRVLVVQQKERIERRRGESRIKWVRSTFDPDAGQWMEEVK